jgi:hypothetical protein
MDPLLAGALLLNGIIYFWGLWHSVRPRSVCDDEVEQPRNAPAPSKGVRGRRQHPSGDRLTWDRLPIPELCRPQRRVLFGPH